MDNSTSPNSTSNSSSSSPLTNNAILILPKLCNIIELFPLLLLLCFTLLNLLIIFRSSLLHKNLKLVLLAQSVAILLYIPTRFGQLFFSNFAPATMALLSPKLFSPLINDVMTFGNMIGHILIVEQLLATLFSKFYENWSGNWFAVGWITCAVRICLNTLNSGC